MNVFLRCLESSVTRLGDLLNFVKISKPLKLRQVICPNHPLSEAIFVNVSKSLIFLLKYFWATFIGILRLFPGHTVVVSISVWKQSLWVQICK